MKTRKLIWLAFALASLALAITPDDLVVFWIGKTPAPAPQVQTIEEGLAFQAKFVAGLEPIVGPKVGYKVGLTSKPVQEKFGVDQPLRGVLLEGMLLESGATVPAKFGAVPIVEADLLVRVKDEGINFAKTPEEVVKHIDQVIPFIELPDLVLKKGEPLNGGTITAINVGARLGVMGKPIPVEPTADFARAMADMKVFAAMNDKLVLQSSGSAILGNPLNAVVWLVEDLAKHGEALEPGDIVSLGSFGKPFRPEPGATFWVGYSWGEWGGEAKVSFK